MEEAASLILVLFRLLNLVGGIVGAVWLLVLGEWQPVVAGVVGGWIFVTIFPLLDFPAVGYRLAALVLAHRHMRRLAWLMRFLGRLWSHLVVLAWCLAVWEISRRLTAPWHLVPFLLWGYGAAIAPLKYTARLAGGINAALTASCAMLVYLGLVLLLHTGTGLAH